jgi:hypothetical protein
MDNELRVTVAGLADVREQVVGKCGNAQKQQKRARDGKINSPRSTSYYAHPNVNIAENILRLATLEACEEKWSDA